jgi:pimeloyl-ACP methyl ester carboxylesterase
MSDVVGQSESSRSRTFVLVHGAWHGGWVFRRVAERLQRQGHRVFTPTLTGLGERSHIRHPGINCSVHIEDVVNLIRWEELRDVVLCGWSYGAGIAGAVADAIPDRIASIVYLDGAVPRNGESIIDRVGADQLRNFTIVAGELGGLWIPPMPATAFNIRSVADRKMVDALSTPQPLATFVQRLTLTGAYMNIPKKAYVLARQWNMLAHDLGEISQDESWEIHEVDCGHHIMLDEPERLTEILTALA